MKTYDRAQVLQVAAQLYPYFAEQVEASIEEEDMDCAADYSVQAARSLIDAVERQCPPPGKPKATQGRCGTHWHDAGCDCNGYGDPR